MSNFQVIKLNNEQYDFLVIATSYENPLNDYDEISKLLKDEKASLLFDLTLINGNSSNRYIECQFEPSSHGFSECHALSTVDASIKSISGDFFSKHEDIVDNGTIPRPLKYMLKRAMA